jgi:hypothetical protein
LGEKVKKWTVFPQLSGTEISLLIAAGTGRETRAPGFFQLPLPDDFAGFPYCCKNIRSHLLWKLLNPAAASQWRRANRVK